MTAEQGRAITPDKPISETPEAISYLGVNLSKARASDSQFVPQRDQYRDFINDRFALDLQRNIAVSFLQGDPMLIEGGTSIGKTTTIRKMAAELGWEVHYANLNGATDVEDLMGRYIPNPNKHSPEDPEYIFADGKVTSGLRIEEGKVKVIILDEYNSAAPNILIRLHEVLDALDRKGQVVLSEDASEGVAVDKNSTKIVALTNPPGKGYFGREPIDPAQLRRWVYYKAPTELPAETFSYSTDTLFGLAPQDQAVPQIDFLASRDEVLMPEQLTEIPGIADISEKYKEFHRGAKSLLRERRIAADQPQLFTFDDRMEPRRVRDFVLRFYNGDINGTFQEALRYYYVNKVEDEADRAQLDELIRHVEYSPSENISQRRSAERGSENLEQELEDTPIDTGSAIEAPRASSDVERREQEAWEKVLGIRVNVDALPSYLTPDIQRRLETLGLELRFIPKLNLRDKAYLESVGLDNFLEDLEKRHPKLRTYDDLEDSEKSDHTVPRGLEQWFWENVRDGKTDFPNLPGQWMAVETVEKPSWGTKYEKTTLADKLGFKDDRFNVSWNDVEEALTKQRRKILKDAGLETAPVDMRQLEAIEWNLLGNREGWGATNSYEWTNTEYREDGASSRLIVGGSDDGGAGYVDGYEPGRRDADVGFRLAVVFGVR